MVLRVEYILLMALATLFSFILLEKPNSVEAVESNSTKEVYFKNFSLIELSEQGIENQLISSEATKYKKSFKFKDINITYQNSHNVVAKKAVYRDDFVYLEDDIWLKRDDGFSFKTNSLQYSLKDKVAYSDEAFRIDMNGSIISGETIRYNLDTKRVSADGIRATVIFE